MEKYEHLNDSTNRKFETVFGKDLDTCDIDILTDVQFRENTLKLREKLDFGISGLVGLILGFVFSVVLNNVTLNEKSIYTDDVLRFTSPSNLDKMEHVTDCEKLTSKEPEKVC